MTAIGLALVAGVALAVQNLLLAAMVGRGLGYVTALALNSAVGFTLLVAVNLAQHGPAVALDVAGAWKTWFLLPGLLGTFVVFALVFGFTNIGAAAPTVALIAGQVITSVVLDQVRSTTPASLNAGTVAGALLCVIGAALVVMARR